MCLPKKPKIPKTVLPQEPIVPRPADRAVGGAQDSERERRRRARGVGSTILTGGAGLLSQASTARATILGG